MNRSPSDLTVNMTLIGGLLLTTVCLACAQSEPRPHHPAKFEVTFPHLQFERPLYVAEVPDDHQRMVVLEQVGRVHTFSKRQDVKRTKVLLDLSHKVSRKGNEEGLLGLAFHPDFSENHTLFLHYSGSEPRRGIIARFRMDPEHETILPESEELMLEVEQPYGNHNGGMIEFGPDGYLYLGFGDGGAGGDPKRNGQNRGTLLASILRIDVDRQSGGNAYAIPPDNPFHADPTAREEIWAYGLRNPWRFSFDSETGILWAGDVGQNDWEEIDIIVKGGNYGWNHMEGHHPYKAGRNSPAFIAPITEHSKKEAKSITGGYVYRGKEIPDMVGRYIYGDYVTGKLWYLAPSTDGTYSDPIPFGKVLTISSFGVDRQHELYLTSFQGKIYRMLSSALEIAP